MSEPPQGSRYPSLNVDNKAWSKQRLRCNSGRTRRILGREPRGEAIVFKLPSDGQSDWIKRVIGLPGDKIQVVRLVLNGEMVPREQSPLI
jgi:signal peptidase I